MKLHSNARTCPHGRALIVSRVTDGGQKPTAVALEFRVTERTVRKWLKRFRAEGATGLTDRSCRPGRIPRRYLQPGEELHHAVFALLHTPPSDHGFNRTSWKLSDLANVLRAQGKTSTQRNIGAVIKAAGYRWKQARVKGGGLASPAHRVASSVPRLTKCADQQVRRESIPIRTRSPQSQPPIKVVEWPRSFRPKGVPRVVNQYRSDRGRSQAAS